MISFSNVVKKYKNFILLDDISFTIPDFAVVCFIGKNDMGKSELFKTFVDNKRIDSGIINMGLDKGFKKIGVVFRDFEKNVGLTVSEYLKFYAKCNNINLDDKKINDILDQFKLNIYKNINVDRLNIGTKRLLSFVKAIIHEPDILVLESPMSDVNNNIKNIIKKTLINFIGKKTIIFTANNFMELGDISTHCGILDNGKLVMFGETDEILEKIQLSTLLELKVLSEEDEQTALNTLKSDERVKSISIDNDKIFFSVDGDKYDEYEILKKLIDNNIKISSYSKDLSSFDFQVDDGNTDYVNTYLTYDILQ